MRSKLKLGAAVSAFLLALLVAIGCGGDGDGGGSGGGSAPGVTDDEVVLGAVMDTTGPSAVYGEGYRLMTDAYLKKINDAGGIAGRQIRWEWENDGYDPAAAAAGARRLVEQENVFAMIYSSGSASAGAMIPYLESQEVPFLMITSDGSSTSPPKHCCYSAITPAEVYGAAMARYAHEELGGERIALIYQNDDFGMAGLEGVRAGAEEAGYELVAEAPAERDATEFSAAVQVLAKADPDIVLMFTPAPASTASVLREGNRVGLDVEWVNNVSGVTPETVDLAPELVEDVYFAYVWPPPTGEMSDDPELAEFQQLMLDAGVELEDQGQQYLMPYVNARLAVEALEIAGEDLTRETFHEALESLTEFDPGTSGPITFKPFDESDQFSRLGNVSVGFGQVQDGNLVSVTDGYISGS